MPAHPDIVPAEHADRGKEDARVEQLLTHAFGGRGDRRGEDRHQRSAEHPRRDAARDPQSAPRRAAARRHDDADDQRGFEYLAEDDDCGRQHRDAPYLTMRRPVVARLKSSKNS